MAEPINKSIHTIMSEITNRTTQKRLELIKKDMFKISNEMSMMYLEVNEINKTYKKILMKDKPVGSSLKAIRHLR
jgi:cob(I)alamin adenosyltransferase